jgi:hypothetical protein
VLARVLRRAGGLSSGAVGRFGVFRLDGGPLSGVVDRRLVEGTLSARRALLRGRGVRAWSSGSSGNTASPPESPACRMVGDGVRDLSFS